MPGKKPNSPIGVPCVYLQSAVSPSCLIYINERHYFQAVWDHLEIWSKKVRPGGILAGHDYLDGVLPSGNFEVKSAVDKWASEKSLTVHCTGEDVWRSWIIQMP